jgi:hypothetical protein
VLVELAVFGTTAAGPGAGRPMAVARGAHPCWAGALLHTARSTPPPQTALGSPGRIARGVACRRGAPHGPASLGSPVSIGCWLPPTTYANGLARVGGAGSEPSRYENQMVLLRGSAGAYSTCQAAIGSSIGQRTVRGWRFASVFGGCIGPRGEVDDRGGRVKGDALVAQGLDAAARQDAEVTASKADVGAGESTVAAAEKDEMVESKEAAAKEEVAAAEAKVAAAEAKVAAAEAKVAAAEAKVAAAEAKVAAAKEEVAAAEAADNAQAVSRSHQQADMALLGLRSAHAGLENAHNGMKSAHAGLVNANAAVASAQAVLDGAQRRLATVLDNRDASMEGV